MKITRRNLAVLLAAPAAVAQTDPQRAAEDRLKANSEALAKQDVPMSTEPAFQFKA